MPLCSLKWTAERSAKKDPTQCLFTVLWARWSGTTTLFPPISRTCIQSRKDGWRCLGPIQIPSQDMNVLAGYSFPRPHSETLSETIIYRHYWRFRWRRHARQIHHLPRRARTWYTPLFQRSLATECLASLEIEITCSHSIGLSTSSTSLEVLTVADATKSTFTSRIPRGS